RQRLALGAGPAMEGNAAAAARSLRGHAALDVRAAGRHEVAAPVAQLIAVGRVGKLGARHEARASLEGKGAALVVSAAAAARARRGAPAAVQGSAAAVA